MTSFTVNGQTVAAPENKRLLRFLRDDLGLTSVKDGCSEGACGTCTVLVDGQPRKACALKTDRLEGAQIITLEGFDPAERDLFARAFAESGAVQCGFCIPGMIVCAKALLDANPSPTPEEVRQALRNNICRCTGYKKIEEAVLLAAAVKRGERELHQAEGHDLGLSLTRVDAYAKAAGTAQYTDDVAMEGLLFGAALRSEYPRAKVLSIDTTEAKQAPGVAAVLTAEDVPGSLMIGHLFHDYPVLIPAGEITRFRGDALALVAGENEESVRAALSLIKVDYQPLPAVFSPEEAMAEGAPLVHESAGSESNLLANEWIRHGDADAALAHSAHTVTTEFRLPFTEHAFLEPECAVAWPEGEGVHVISGDQGIYQTQKEVALMLDLAPEKVRVEAAMVGGGFGGKEDMSVQHHAALLAWATGKPVKVRLTRAESMQIHPKRHPMHITVTTGCDEKGMLTGLKAKIVSDTGAYASLGGPVLQRACTHCSGPYRYSDLDVDGRAYYTNNPPAGAFRGFGVTQSVTVSELNLDLLAEKVGISPWQIRYQNAVRPGDKFPNGQTAGPDTALIETLEAVKPFYDAHPGAGVACAMKNSGLGVGIPDIGRCRLLVHDGKVFIHSSAACIGQGMGTVLLQMVMHVTGLSEEDIVYARPDTRLAPDSGNTTASRQTLFTGEACRVAATRLKEALDEAGSLSALNGREYYGEYSGATDFLNTIKEDPVFHVAYGFATHCVALDEEGRIAAVAAAHDVGRAINPKSVEGQIEGGVTMSLGYALTEDFPLDEGRPTAKYGTLGLLRAPQVPPIETFIVSNDLPDAEREKLPAAGAKGVGEIASIPTPAAVIAAYYHRSGQLEHSLPLKNTPYGKK